MKCCRTEAFCVAVFYILLISFVSSTSLYSPDDPLWELDVTNFDRVIYSKSNFWIIEFYNNWCGHCIRFAPVWKIFSRDIRTWRNVIDVAVVNCAEAQNTKLCREYDVNSYPTIRLYQPYVNGTDKGDSLNGEREVSSLEIAIIKYLELHWNDNKSDKWPVLQPFDANNMKDIVQSIPENEDSHFLFIEHADSFTGRKVILDLSLQRNIVIRRVLTSNHVLLNDPKLDFKNSSSSSLMKVFTDGTQETIFRFSKETNESYVRDQVFQYITGEPRNKDFHFLHDKKKPPSKVLRKNYVHMTDLENALYYSLRQEIGVVKDIHGDKFRVLLSFLSALKTYFPGEPYVMDYLTKLHNRVSSKTGNITGEEFIQDLDQLQTSNQYIPEMREWVGCKGSDPKYRGYPCSLWTLFHTLTVQAYNMYEDAHGYMKDDTVLFTIRNYVRHFFTCEECAENFAKMAENMEMDIKSPQDTVLWLWNAHNKVNKRLAGDVTEDPKHPKIQFPSLRTCSKCRIQKEDSDDIVWDNSIVLRFLRHFYGKQNIVRDDKGDHRVYDQHSFPAAQNLNNSSMVITFKTVSFLERWSFQWFTNTDISLCVSLYFVSALLLVIIFLLFRQRRRRKKIQKVKYINLYP